jgi:hypothetical protein
MKRNRLGTVLSAGRRHGGAARQVGARLNDTEKPIFAALIRALPVPSTANTRRVFNVCLNDSI